MSVKNTLQEYIQHRREGLPFPVYSTILICKASHSWQSTVTVLGRCYTGCEFPSKKDAEKDAAKLALASIDETVSESKRSLPPRTAILVDLENRANGVNKIFEMFTIPHSSKIYGILAAGNQSLDKKCKPREGFNLLRIPCTRPDGADVGLVMYMSHLLSKGWYDRYIILSNDHFADAASDCVNSASEFLPIHFEKICFSCKDFKSLVKILDKVPIFSNIS